MKYIVMKFGGTSVEDAAAIKRTAAIVATRRAPERQPIVVVSAMAKVTDQLLLAANTAARGEREAALAITERLLLRHHAVAAELNTDASWLAAEFAALDEVLRGLSAVGELTPRISDMIVSYGERLSSRMIAALFAPTELKGVHIDARRCIITDAQHMRAIPDDARIEEQLRKLVLPHTDAGRTVVLGGFIGATEAGATHDTRPRRFGLYRGTGWRGRSRGSD